MKLFEVAFIGLDIICYLIGDLATTQLYFIRNIEDNYMLYWYQKGEWKL